MEKNNFKAKNETYFEFMENPYNNITITKNYILEDDRVSDKAIGLYMRIIKWQNSEEHKIYVKGLITAKNKKDSILSSIKELINAGYLKREALRDGKGHFNGYKYNVFFKPIDTSYLNENIDKKPPSTENGKSDSGTQQEISVDEILAESGKSDFGKSEDGKSATNKYNTNKNTIHNSITTVEKNTHLKLTENQKKIVSTWNDKEKLDRAIIVFKNLQGKYFKLLGKIYKDGAHFTKEQKVDNFNNFGQRDPDGNFHDGMTLEQTERKLLGWDA
jgi:hypothetical protein